MSPEIRELNRNVKKLLEVLDKNEELIDESAACAYLGISKKTIQNYVALGKMDGTFEINVIGNRMYRKSKLIKRI